MIKRVFGLKEAQRAGEFAKTKEQRLTVLAVVKMLGMPITVQDEAKQKVTALESVIKRKSLKILKFENKVIEVKSKRLHAELNKIDAIGTSKEWFVG